MLKTKYNKTTFTYASGFTLIELMLAMLIGIIIMGGVMQMFITTRDTQRTSVEQTQLVADARFVLDTMAYDLRHAGIWGGTNETGIVLCGRASGSTFVCPPADDIGNIVTNDCDNSDWYRDLGRPVFGYNNTNLFAGNCSSMGYKVGTDVLGVHYADSIPVPTNEAVPGAGGALDANTIYIRSNILGGQLFKGVYPTSAQVPRWIDNPRDSRTKNYPLRSLVYYVSSYTNTPGDGVPSLHRSELSTGPAMIDRVLIPGVEDLQLEYGVDTTGDFQVDTYMNAKSVENGPDGLPPTAPPTDSSYWETGDVFAVKISLLMRAITPDKDGIGGTRAYTLAGGLGAGGSDVAAVPGIHRFLMTRTVRLRNTMRRDLSKAGV